MLSSFVTLWLCCNYYRFALLSLFSAVILRRDASICCPCVIVTSCMCAMLPSTQSIPATVPDLCICAKCTSRIVVALYLQHCRRCRHLDAPYALILTSVLQVHQRHRVSGHVSLLLSAVLHDLQHQCLWSHAGGDSCHTQHHCRHCLAQHCVL